jgi:plastocyanin
MVRAHRAKLCAPGALAVLAAGAAHAEVVAVTMRNIAFEPSQVTAHVGDTVAWSNADIVVHTATARNGAWDVLVAPSGKKAVELKSAGTIEYFCRFHPNMSGRIDVVP